MVTHRILDMLVALKFSSNPAYRLLPRLWIWDIFELRISINRSNYSPMSERTARCPDCKAVKGEDLVLENEMFESRLHPEIRRVLLATALCDEEVCRV